MSADPPPVGRRPAPPDAAVDMEQPALPLSDTLAVGRTSLSNERTLLAYLRTGLQFSVAGVSLVKLFDDPLAHTLGLWLLPGGFLVAGIGILLFAIRQVEIARNGGVVWTSGRARPRR